MDRIDTSAEAMEGAVLGRSVHTDPDAPDGVEQGPLPKKVAAVPPGDKTPAQWAYERLILYIRRFEEGLDADHEVSMGFAAGSGGLLRIEGLGFFPPDMVTFYGADQSGTKTQLIQHVGQLNVWLRAISKRTEGPATRIGFQLARDLEDDSDDS